MRRITQIGGAFFAAIAATPLQATNNLSCGGARDTPSIELLVGAENSVAQWSFNQNGRSILTDPALRWTNRSSPQRIAMTATRRSNDVVARRIATPFPTRWTEVAKPFTWTQAGAIAIIGSAHVWPGVPASAPNRMPSGQ